MRNKITISKRKNLYCIVVPTCKFQHVTDETERDKGRKKMEMTLTDKILSFCSASIPEMPQSKEAISPMAGLEIYNILAFLSGDSQFLDSALSSLVNYASVK